MSRLSRRAFKDSSSSSAFIRKASSPPRCSTERRACALMVIRTRFFSASLSSVTLQRLGRKRRLVRRLAWLTLLPVSTALPVSSQRRAMSLILLSNCTEPGLALSDCLEKHCHRRREIYGYASLGSRRRHKHAPSSQLTNPVNSPTFAGGVLAGDP